MPTKAETADREAARILLRGILKPGDTILCNLRHVSRSGMLRVIDLHVIKDGDMQWIGALAARAIGEKYDRKSDGIRVGGCGMDTGFHLVSTLSHYLYPEGFECIGEGCPANDHSNGDRDRTPHMHTGGAGAYALRHRWL